MTRDEFLLEEHLVKRALKVANGLIRFLESTPDPPLPRWKPKPPKAALRHRPLALGAPAPTPRHPYASHTPSHHQHCIENSFQRL